MNIINKLTLRQLLLNKKRTLITIIGTIISAAMITAVATLGLSFMDIMQRQSIAQNGEWHVKYSKVNQQQLEAIQSNNHVKKAMMNREVGYSYLEGSKNTNKPYLYVLEFDKAAFQHMPIKLMEGRMPEKSNEILLSEAVRTNAKVKYSIGDKIELAIGQRTLTSKDIQITEPLTQKYGLQYENDKIVENLTQDKKQTYTIVGFMERPDWELTWAPGYTSISYIDQKTVAPNETFDVSVIFKKVNSKLFSWGDKIASANGIKSYGFNNDLLRYYGIIRDDGVKNMLFTFSGIIIVIIVIGSVSLIYNAFAISVSERSRYLGMLSSVGATKKQKRNSVFFEGTVIGAISIPLGIIAGYAGLGITYLFINPMLERMIDVKEGFRLVVYPSSLLISFLVSGVTILISTYIPARKASNVSAIDAIRQVTDVKFNRKQIRTSFLTRKIFGIEGELGLKNLKRYKARYKATVFSLIISMILFLVVSSFTSYLRKSVEMTQEGINFDIQATLTPKSDAMRENVIKKINSLDYIKDKTILQRLNATTWIDENAIADFLIENKKDFLKDGKYPYNVEVDVLDDENLEAYTKQLGISKEKLTDTNQLSCIVIDTVNFKDEASDKYVETKILKTNVGADLSLAAYNSNTNKEESLPSIKIAKLTKEMPMGVMSAGKVASFYVIVSKEAFQKLIQGKEDVVNPNLSTAIYISSDKPLLLQEKLEAIQNEVGVGTLNIFNIYYYKQSEQQALLLVSVFTYAFIILITAICIANIINTISTSIALRKREFAMLKSIGITPKGFNRMLNYESIFYGIKALLYGLPISILVMYLMYGVLMKKFEFAFTIPFGSIIIVVVAVFLIVSMAMIYSSSRVRKENIIDALKQEII
jgi:ABC-type transport system, involved in lipoprotein release, permease component